MNAESNSDAKEGSSPLSAHTDRHSPLAWLDEELRQLREAALFRELRVRARRQGMTFQLDGREVINFGSNDYLGIATQPLSLDAPPASQYGGRGSGASPLVTGHGEAHQALEQALADFEGTEAALLFSSGYAANVGVVAALAGKGDVIFSDAKNHASLIDGCRLSGARVQVYPHCEVTYLEMMLRQATGFRRRFIVTDSLFSMDGDMAPLPDLVKLAIERDALLIVDEAHATGVFGNRGRGVAEHFDLEQDIPVRVGTLSKALGGIGGFVAGERRLIDWLINRSRTLIFSTALPDYVAAQALESLGVVRNEPARRVRLRQKSADVRQRLIDQGWNVGQSESQIVPVFIGEPAATSELAARLREAGCFVPAIRPPSVPAGESLLRISLSAAHTDDQLERLLTTLADLAR